MEEDSDNEKESGKTPKIGAIETRLWPDQTRLTLKVKLLDLDRPLSLSLAIHDQQDVLVVETNIIETVDSEFELTMHLPSQKSMESLKLKATLFDKDDAQIDQQTIPLML